MLHQNIKDNTTAAHQKLEGTVVRQLKAIRSNTDYADVLKKLLRLLQYGRTSDRSFHYPRSIA